MSSPLFYIEIKTNNTLSQVIDTLKRYNLKTDVIKGYYGNHTVIDLIDGDMIMWCNKSAYPTFVFHSQKEIIKACGVKIEIMSTIK